MLSKLLTSGSLTLSTITGEQSVSFSIATHLDGDFQFELSSAMCRILESSGFVYAGRQTTPMGTRWTYVALSYANWDGLMRRLLTQH